MRPQPLIPLSAPLLTFVQGLSTLQDLTIAMVKLITSLLVQNAEGKREFARSVGYPALLSLLLPVSASAPRRSLPASFWATAPDVELLKVDSGARRASTLLRPRMSRGDVLAFSATRGRRTAMVGQTFGLQSVPSSAALLGDSLSAANLLAAIPTPGSVETSGASIASATATATPTAAGTSGQSLTVPLPMERRASASTELSASEHALEAFVPLPVPESLVAAAMAAPASPWRVLWEGLVETLMGMMLDDPGYTKVAASIGTEVVNNADLLPVRRSTRPCAPCAPGRVANIRLQPRPSR